MSDLISSSIVNNINTARFQTDSQELAKLKENLTPAKAKQDAKLKDAAQQFEAVFINQLLQEMDKTVQRSEFMHGGQGEEVFRGLFYQEIAKDISKNSSLNIGLGKQVYEQLSRQL